MTRDEILSAGGLVAAQTIDIPEWGGTYKLLPLNGEQMEEIQLLAEQARSTGNYLCLKGLRGKVATWVIADEDGKLLFRPADARRLMDNHAQVVSRIFERVKSMNAMTEDEAEAIEKN